jgi:hypothetical protein
MSPSRHWLIWRSLHQRGYLAISRAEVFGGRLSFLGGRFSDLRRFPGSVPSAVDLELDHGLIIRKRSGKPVLAGERSPDKAALVSTGHEGLDYSAVTNIGDRRSVEE